MFLSQEEVQELTGYKKYTCQARWLRSNGFKYVIGYDGKPKVTADHVNILMGSIDKNARKKTEPNYAMFENRKF